MPASFVSVAFGAHTSNKGKSSLLIYAKNVDLVAVLCVNRATVGGECEETYGTKVLDWQLMAQVLLRRDASSKFQDPILWLPVDGNAISESNIDPVSRRTYADSLHVNYWSSDS
jgi:hypothetical protein